ncbi:MAG: exodeoxyribonuclease III [Corynebacterium sp.]|nr:exodeoxyribonuclease III [Corynebacterium sp.]
MSQSTIESPQKLRVGSWNINSIRARHDRVTNAILNHDLDVLALQEIKAKPEQVPDFPELREAGYEWHYVGYNQWNGVALFSRVGLDNIRESFPNQPGFAKDAEAPQPVEARALGATCGGVDMWSVYVPNGRALTDRHYTYKLEWLDKLHDYVAATEGPMIIMGDYNVAPREQDVWETYAGETHISAPERAAFHKLLDAGLTDAAAPFYDGYTYWDYMAARFRRDHGMRIDFQLTRELTATNAFIDREERATKGTSDHALLVVEYEC